MLKTYFAILSDIYNNTVKVVLQNTFFIMKRYAIVKMSASS